MDIKLPIQELDDKSREYLDTIRRTEGRGSSGVYIAENRPNGIGGPILAMLIGTALLIVAGILCAVPAGRKPLFVLQAMLAGLGMLVLFGGIRGIRFRRRFDLGSFRHADALHLWDVNSQFVTATPLSDLRDVDGIIMRDATYGYAMYCELTLRFPNEQKTVLLAPDGRSEELFAYLQSLIVLRRERPDDSEPMHAGLMGMVAKQMASSDDAEFSDAVFEEELQTPERNTSRIGWVDRRVSGWIAATAAVVVAWFACPAVSDYLYDEDLYQKVLASSDTDLETCRGYLNVFPAGRHADEVRAIRDDHRFTLAQRKSDTEKGPTHLRTYLADAENSRHRDEARKLIAVYYDQAIARLKSLSKDRKVEPQLFNGLVAILEGLKTQQRPVVTVGFRGTQEARPKTAAAKMVEEIQVSSILNDPAVKRLVRHGQAAKVIEPGRTFENDATRHRERLILSQLRTAIRKVLDSDILTLENARPGTRPTILVDYRIYTNGRLYKYTSTRTTYGSTIGTLRDSTTTFKGMLRGYQADWKIEIQPPQGGKAFVWSVGSVPADSLEYRRSEGDPNWAPYGVILFSAFHDMSCKLIHNFGLKPSKAPKEITHQMAIGRG